MSDLDDLASATRSKPPGQDPRLVPAYMPPEPRRRMGLWIGLGVGVAIFIALLAFLLLASRATVVTVKTVTIPVATSLPTTSMATPDSEPAAPQIPTPATRPRIVRAKRPLQDIADPFQALDIYHLQRGQGDTIEIKARNISKRGLFVKSVELYAESNDRTAIDNIGFWLPAGEAIISTRDVPELSRRLGEDEGIKAVVNEAEFRDTEPAAEEMADRPVGTNSRRDATE